MDALRRWHRGTEFVKPGAEFAAFSLHLPAMVAQLLGLQGAVDDGVHLANCAFHTAEVVARGGLRSHRHADDGHRGAQLMADHGQKSLLLVVPLHGPHQQVGQGQQPQHRNEHAHGHRPECAPGAAVNV